MSDLSSLIDTPEAFAVAGHRPLRPYQEEVARAVVASVLGNEGKTFTVMFARQMGKNELSAQLEAYLLALFSGRGGSIVKAAPSFKPQIVNSILRLKRTLDANPVTAGRWNPAFGYMLEVGKANIAFFSADPSANVVGATASLLLEIDEAQDVAPEKYDRDFRPMASSTNATTVLYGTAWHEDSLLQRQKAVNLEREQRTGERLHFEADWRALAAVNPAYGAFVRAEMERLGADHPSIRTQYLLLPLSDAGRLFSVEQRQRLSGTHARLRGPMTGIYVAGIDVAGEDENAEDAMARALVPKRDSTVVTIAEVTRDAEGRAVARIVEHVWWTGRDQVWQYERLTELWERWRLARACVDATGIGSGLAAFLARRYPGRVEEFVFSAPSKSRLAFEMLGMINTGRASIYGDDGSAEWRECWSEIRAARYHLRTNEQMAWGVPETEGHDDFVVSLALALHAAESSAPLPHSGLIRPERDDEPGW